MAYDSARLERALINADKAGDTGAATAFANEIRRMRQTGTAPEMEREPDLAEKMMANPAIKFARGAAAPVMGLSQMILNAISPERGKAFQEEYIDRPAAMEKSGEKGQGFLEKQAGNVTGLIGNVLSPVNLGIGKLLPVAGTMIGRIKQGATIGAAAGATAPVVNAGDDYAGRKITNTVLGALLGGVLPAGWEGTKMLGRGMRNLIQPMFGNTGLDKATGRLANAAAGENKEAVIKALEQTKDIVPGSRLTAGQASVPANSAEFAALQEIASKVRPSTYYGPLGIQGQQESARLAQIQKISGGADNAALNSAVAERKAITDPFYASVEKSKAKVDARDVFAKVNEYLKKEGNKDIIKIPLENIKKKLITSDEGKMIKIENNPQALASLSGDIKIKMGSKTQNGQPEYDVKVLSEIKDILDNAIGKAEPAYAKVRALYKEKSIPVNQMRVGKELEDKLLNPSGKETSGSYLKAMDDSYRVLKDATGFSRYKDLGQVLKEKMSLATGVAKDLENNLTYGDLARKGSAAAREKIGEVTNFYKGVGLLSTPMVITNAIINRLEGKIGELTAGQLAMKMQTPGEMAKIMRGAKPFERQALIDALMKYQGTAAGSMAARENQ